MITRTTVFLVVLAWPAFAADFEVKVVGVSDDDTVRVLDDKKIEIKVRLAGSTRRRSARHSARRARKHCPIRVR